MVKNMNREFRSNSYTDGAARRKGVITPEFGEVQHHWLPKIRMKANFTSVNRRAQFLSCHGQELSTLYLYHYAIVISVPRKG